MNPIHEQISWLVFYNSPEKENSITIVVSQNDLDMLKNAGIAVTMGNVAKEVKDIADYISIKYEYGGVGYAIEKLVLNN